MQADSAQGKASSSIESEGPDGHEHWGQSKPSQVWWVFLGLTLVLLGTACLSLDDYSVKTTVRLNFDRSLGQAERSALLDQEVGLLRSEELRNSVANSLGRTLAGDWKKGIEHILAWPERPATFGLQSATEWWHTPQVSVVPAVTATGASVTLAVSGEDPERLRKTLSEYVRQYVDYKRSPGPTAGPGCPTGIAAKMPIISNDAIKEITGRIGKIRITENQCELALGMLDATKGTFRGFIPSCDLAGMPALKQFQDRIVELAIKARELRVRFTPQSREIQDLEVQIQGIRDAMKEYIAAQLQFLKKNRENLLAQKAEMLHRQCAEGKPLSPANWQFPGRTTGNPFPVTRGLRVQVDEPAISERPLLLTGLAKIKSALESVLCI